ncbi:hypothetical protein LBMAG42_12420 [Deltaproteobacteria bacterium]|nr:hypothetical protein LBMAG42_12420 [Deltaproteobacteria bacterium]
MITSLSPALGSFTGLETPNATRPGAGPSQADAAGGAEFGGALQSAVKSVEGHMAESDEKMFKVASGQDQDYAGMMVALEEANISLRAMGSVRDKMVEAYQAIWNMPV